MSETHDTQDKPFEAGEPFEEGETVYHRILGKAQFYYPFERSAFVKVENDGEDIVDISDLSRTPWEAATPTQEAPDDYRMSDILTPEQLTEIEAREKVATPAPWLYTPGLMFKHYVSSENGDLGFSLQEMHPRDGRDVPAEANALFITHARQDVPALLAMVASQTRELEALRKVVAAAREWSRDTMDYLGALK